MKKEKKATWEIKFSCGDLSVLSTAYHATLRTTYTVNLAGSVENPDLWCALSPSVTGHERLVQDLCTPVEHRALSPAVRQLHSQAASGSDRSHTLYAKLATATSTVYIFTS
ncbi:hypothetical protein RRG08_049189 [Elysia crispata]|uniref:Uncharacterized protein n=1 Tax=Elysia crispata TaxID=231223 RepID=A0AAE1ARM9_9GAST|nr:hypothetical protein RRG08_049189 [Elysia crispata]